MIARKDMTDFADKYSNSMRLSENKHISIQLIMRYSKRKSRIAMPESVIKKNK
jgi:hypothetical protein